ncbi:MAG: hypothetical protein SV487_00070 [Thermodesulfobacteriota bacterium]|nr:hypothetical protein [Thermodesulfobacteriota bacterium]
MAAKPDCLQRRSLFNSPKAAPEKLAEMAREYAIAGFLPDAVDFFAKAGDEEALDRLLAVVLEEGDYFLFSRIKSILGRETLNEEWEALAGNASRQGKAAFAAQARDHLEKVKSEPGRGSPEA